MYYEGFIKIISLLNKGLLEEHCSSTVKESYTCASFPCGFSDCPSFLSRLSLNRRTRGKRSVELF